MRASLLYIPFRCGYLPFPTQLKFRNLIKPKARSHIGMYSCIARLAQHNNTKKQVNLT